MGSNDRAIFFSILAVILMCIIFWVSTDVSNYCELKVWVDSGHKQIKYVNDNGWHKVDWVYIDPNDEVKDE